MKLRNDLVLRHLGDEHVIVDPGQEMVDMSKVYTLNQTAAFLWEALQEKDFTQETVVGLLLEHYEVTRDLAEKDAKQLLKEFAEQNLLVV